MNCIALLGCGHIIYSKNAIAATTNTRRGPEMGKGVFQLCGQQ